MLWGRRRRRWGRHGLSGRHERQTEKKHRAICLHASQTSSELHPSSIAMLEFIRRCQSLKLGIASALIPCGRGPCVIWRTGSAGNRGTCIVRARVARIFLLHAPAAWTCSRTRTNSTPNEPGLWNVFLDEKFQILRPRCSRERKHRPVNLQWEAVAAVRK